MSKTRMVSIFFGASLFCTQLVVTEAAQTVKQDNAPAAPASMQPGQPSTKNKNLSANETSKPPKEYLVGVYILREFCFNKIGESLFIDDKIPVGDKCKDNQIRFRAQNASDVVKALSFDSDFDVKAVGLDQIVVYRKTDKAYVADTDNRRLGDITTNAAKMARPPFRWAKVISVPSGTSDHITAQLNSLNIGGLTAKVAGNDRLLLESDDTPSPFTSEDLEKRVNDLVWDRPSAPPTQRLFYLDAATVVKDLSLPAASGSGTKSDESNGSSSKSADGGKLGAVQPAVAVTVTATGSQQDSQSGSGSKGLDPKADAKSSSTTVVSPQDAPSAASKITGNDGTPKTSDAPKPLTMQSVLDTVVYSNSDGSDQKIAEATRLMTMLDLPRPEVLLNMWSLQVSSPYPDVVNKNSDAVREAVSHHNDVLQRAIEDGWDYLSRASKKASFFEPTFYNYVTQKFIIDSAAPLAATSTVAGDKVFDGIDSKRKEWGWCDADEYCLGFAHAFEPLRPTFTNILLTIAASNTPETTAQEAIQYMTGSCAAETTREVPNLCPRAETSNAQLEKEATKPRKTFLRCVANAGNTMGETATRAKTATTSSYSISDCETRDRMRLVQQVLDEGPESLQLNCFAEQAKRSFARGEATHQTTRVGLLRAAIVDFLFNYKMAQQFPHDFITYDLSQSAQELNAEFNPLVLSFNRDVSAFTQHLQTELRCKQDESETRRWFGDERGTFVNDGMLAVRGISGVESIVDTVTQNYFDATQPPNLTDLVKSVSDAEKGIPGVLSANLTSHEAAVLIGALNSVQPAQAKIGRQLSLDITPHALASASSAELDVKLTNQETADPTLFKSGKNSEDALSRVSRHNTTTKVRVESLKLFDVSSFSAMLQRPRTRFPILPPFFEVPYFGSFIGIPLPGAKEYHRSTAIVSAVIVPTAADLAYGIDFSSDRVCDIARDRSYGVAYADGNHYKCHRAKSFSDLRGLPFRNYHKAIVQCLASGGYVRYTGSLLSFGLRLPEQLRNEAQDQLEPDKQRTNEQPQSQGCKFRFKDVPPSE